MYSAADTSAADTSAADTSAAANIQGLLCANAPSDVHLRSVIDNYARRL